MEKTDGYVRLFYWGTTMQDIETLQRLFNREGGIKIVSGPAEIPIIEIDTAIATAKISLYGAHMLAYKPKQAKQDLFYLSQEAIYKQGKAIRGGVPLCWPWFGDDPAKIGRQAHGFARNVYWSLLDCQLHDDIVDISLGLRSSASSRMWWPCDFNLKLTITVADTLTIKLSTENSGELAAAISCALHSYFLVGDIDQVHVEGLDGIDYLDKTQQFEQFVQSGDIRVSSETDRVYLHTPKSVRLVDKAFNRVIEIDQHGAENMVVWNPWDKAQSLADMPDQDYQRFICVETANAIANKTVVSPGTFHETTVTYRISEQG
jgi:glucose-6-phosphate 1-epimerase